MRSKLKRIQFILGFTIGMLFLSGCAQTELEERCFPMLAAVGMDDTKVTYGLSFPKESDAVKRVPVAKNNSFATCRTEYEERLNRMVDYNHLKVLVFEDEVLSNQRGELKNILDDLSQTELFPRNTLVCVVDDIEDLFETDEKLTQDMGIYLEEYLKVHAPDARNLVTLGDLLDEKENQSLTLLIPFLEVEEEYVQWNGSVNINEKTWLDF